MKNVDGKHLEMNKFNVAIIGCGKIAGLYNLEGGRPYSHARAFKECNKFNLIACADLNINSARSLAELYDFPIYSDSIQDIFSRAKIDVVSICTNDDSHYIVCKEILSLPDSLKPKVIFLEKPCCSNLEEFNILVELSNKSNVKVIVNHTRRFDINHNLLKTKISNGEFGKLIRGDMYYYGGLYHNGVHLVDTIYYLFESKMQFVNIVKNSKSKYIGDSDLDFSISLNNAHVNITCFDDEIYQIFELDFKFEKARVRIEDFGNIIKVERKYINDINENVLRDPVYLEKSHMLPMENAVEQIGQYLCGNTNILDDKILQNIKNTMEFLWSIPTNEPKI